VPVVCALVPAYKVAVARLTDPALASGALIVADKRERGHVLALDEAAYALGARPGMTLVQAAACAREAAIAYDDPVRCRALWERALDALDAASPLEDAGDGTAFLEMRGIAGDEARWLESVRDAFADDAELSTLPFHVAIAPNKFTARAAARVRDGSVVRAGDERSFLAPLPLRFLDLDRTTIERLQLFGVLNLRTLAALPHGPFVRRFGAEAAVWHARAGGVDDEPIVPRERRTVIDRSLFGEGTAEREDQLLFALRTLVSRVAEDLGFAGKRCAALRLEMECEDGERIALATTLAQPTSQTATIFDLLRARLEGVVLRSPVVGLRLAAERLEEGGAELSLFAGRDPDPEIVGIALARLEAALGPHAARRAHVAAGNRYESRVAYAPFTATDITRTTRAALATASERDA
jgi:protein ImuB